MIKEFSTVFCYKPVLSSRTYMPSSYYIWKMFNFILCLNLLILDVDFRAD